MNKRRILRLQTVEKKSEALQKFTKFLRQAVRINDGTDAPSAVLNPLMTMYLPSTVGIRIPITNWEDMFWSLQAFDHRTLYPHAWSLNFPFAHYFFIAWPNHPVYEIATLEWNHPLVAYMYWHYLTTSHVAKDFLESLRVESILDKKAEKNPSMHVAPAPPSVLSDDPVIFIASHVDHMMLVIWYYGFGTGQLPNSGSTNIRFGVAQDAKFELSHDGKKIFFYSSSDGKELGTVSVEDLFDFYTGELSGRMKLLIGLLKTLVKWHPTSDPDNPKVEIYDKTSKRLLGEVHSVLGYKVVKIYDENYDIDSQITDANAYKLLQLISINFPTWKIGWYQYIIRFLLEVWTAREARLTRTLQPAASPEWPTLMEHAARAVLDSLDSLKNKSIGSGPPVRLVTPVVVKRTSVLEQFHMFDGIDFQKAYLVYLFDTAEEEEIIKILSTLMNAKYLKHLIQYIHESTGGKYDEIIDYHADDYDDYDDVTLY